VSFEVAIQRCLKGDIGHLMNNRIFQGTIEGVVPCPYLVWVLELDETKDDSDGYVWKYSVEVHIWGKSDQDQVCRGFQDLVRKAFRVSLEGSMEDSLHLDGWGRVSSHSDFVEGLWRNAATYIFWVSAPKT